MSALPINTTLTVNRIVNKIDRKRRLAELAEKASRIQGATGEAPLSFDEFSSRQPHPNAASQTFNFLKLVALGLLVGAASGLVTSAVIGGPITLAFMSYTTIIGGIAGLSFAVGNATADNHASIRNYADYLQNFEMENRSVSPSLTVGEGLGLTSNLSQRLSAERLSPQQRQR